MAILFIKFTFLESDTSWYSCFYQRSGLFAIFLVIFSFLFIVFFFLLSFVRFFVLIEYIFVPSLFIRRNFHSVFDVEHVFNIILNLFFYTFALWTRLLVSKMSVGLNKIIIFDVEEVFLEASSIFLSFLVGYCH